ncbi:MULTISPECIES: hypothetical protein [Bacillus cereus group]|uniref:hypothetical protein n=1 Tax=Bacillus cereus group TaxID=86661 RepID=UPI0018F61BEE|nr:MULTISPECIES: hypothetical protein [Bacillus cereus group]MBJ8093275.1 hypothetical protein [Bacillus cereus]CAH2466771.1 hypothetical protein ACOSJ1_EBGNOMHC_02096 [Bacillus mycoides KBAB4]
MSLFKFLFRRNDAKKQAETLDETPYNMESKLIITSTMGESSPTGEEHNDYYVYEWFVTNTNEVFYVGKGRSKRYKDKNRDDIFKNIQEKLSVDTRIVYSNLSEEESLEKESELAIQRFFEGNTLINRITPFSIPNIYWVVEKRLGYSEDELYRNIDLSKRNWNSEVYQIAESLIVGSLPQKETMNLPQYDKITLENLLATHFIHRGVSHNAILEVFDFKVEDPFEELEKKVKEVESFIEEHGGRIYASQAKKAKSFIFKIDESKLGTAEMREQRPEVKMYRLYDVLQFIESFKV